jgi:hypothetical protein
MSTVTREQVLEWVAKNGPLQNLFLIAEDDKDPGSVMVWWPDVGLRYMIIERDELYKALKDYLREAGVRRFKSEGEAVEAMYKEKWEGWDTCADYQRLQQALEKLASRGKK